MAVGQPTIEALTLRGRREECARLGGLLNWARAGRSGVLVLVGEAGVGKTELLNHAVRSAPGMLVVRAVGVESEMELPFAALHQLCAPLLDRLERVPAPQRAALAIAFGLREGPAPDRFFVGLAVLGLLSEAAAGRGLLCVVDDAQWLDRASAQCVAFVARRLVAESVLMLFAARERGDLLDGLPELPVQGLRTAEARSLLLSVMPGRLDEAVADQLVAETRGNPLALLELPRGLTAAQLAGGFALPGALSLSFKIEESYRRRLEALPAETQRLLLVAAAEPLGDGALLRRAAERFGITAAILRPAESVGLIEVDARVRFRHPLVRSAIYRAASPDERRLAHRALGEATDARVDPDRRAWHLAEAADGPDEGVAAELERAAGRAQARGGLAAAGAFLKRAAELTPEPGCSAERSLAAAQAEFEAGALENALALLVIVERGAVDPPQLAGAQLLHARIAFALRRGNDAPPLLLKAARQLEPIDPTLARTTYLEALFAAMFAGRLARGASVVEVSEAALAGPSPPGALRPPDRLLHGLAVWFTDGYAAGAPVLKDALQAFQRETEVPFEEARWLWFASRVALYLWDDDTWAVLSARHLDLVREAGALAALPSVLANRSGALYEFLGELSEAPSYEGELRSATEATGIAALYSALTLAAMRGQEAEFTELIRTEVSDARARGEGLALTVAERLGGVLYNGLGRYDAALVAIGQAERFYTEGPAMGTLTELIEAAVRSGRPERAHGALERIVETTRASGTEWALGIEARCRALLEARGEADSLYREAIERLERTRIRVHLARAHLLYGEWLRRERRRRDARRQLRTAFEMFNVMGIDAFAARAERELEATGERIRRRHVETKSALTAREAQIARLAHEGLSNAEIGERLFVSRHTVAYHLHNVFDKLGIASRHQLEGVLDDDAAGGSPDGGPDRIA